MRVFFLLFFVTFSVIAQTEQPQKESSSDLRSGLNMFVIERPDEQIVIWLERTSNLDYLLRMKGEGDKTGLQKVTTKDALKLDREFASKFLKIQYELPSDREGCKVTLRLTMKGDVQDICKKEERKSQEIASFVKDLENRLVK